MADRIPGGMQRQTGVVLVTKYKQVTLRVRKATTSSTIWYNFVQEIELFTQPIVWHASLLRTRTQKQSFCLFVPQRVSASDKLIRSVFDVTNAMHPANQTTPCF